MKLLKLYGKKVLGAISGFDRIRFRGTIRWLANETGMLTFLSQNKILLKDFEKWSTSKTKKISDSCENQASRFKIEIKYLTTGAIDKEKYVRSYAEQNNIKGNGPICMLSVVEPCISPKVSGNRKTKKLELKMIPRKCKWYYLYFDSPDFGFGHVRLQTWLPMTIFINLNGRHWLEKQLIKNNIAYIKDRNSFPWVKDINSARELMNEQLTTNWNALLNSIALSLCPNLHGIFNPKLDYYWSADETEWATDVMFKSKAELDKLYPLLLSHGMSVSDSISVLRYLGKSKITTSGKIRGVLPNEIMTECRKRFEGIRLKHWVNSNSVKMYNKSGNLLRFETTITNTREFKVFRKPENDDTKPESWLKMRKGVADLHRRCQISQQSNTRYADTISATKVKETLKEVSGNCCQRITKKGRKYRALNPWNIEDFKLLLFITKGGISINGFRNSDLKFHLFGNTKKLSEKDKKYFSGKATRYIRLLRGHGLIRKVPKENRYVLTEKGRKFSTSLIYASNVDIEKLMDIAQ